MVTTMDKVVLLCALSYLNLTPVEFPPRLTSLIIVSPQSMLNVDVEVEEVVVSIVVASENIGGERTGE